jgi:hypothetical protein
LSDVIFSDNYADLAAGVGAKGATLYLSHSLLERNRVLYDGAAVLLESEAVAFVTNSTLHGNAATEGGGGLFVGTKCTATISNCTIELNTAQVACCTGLVFLCRHVLFPYCLCVVM